MERIEGNMADNLEIEKCVIKAIEGIETYITQTTGVKPTQQEISNALSKFFVLKEILEFVKLERGDK